MAFMRAPRFPQTVVLSIHMIAAFLRRVLMTYFGVGTSWAAYTANTNA